MKLDILTHSANKAHLRKSARRLRTVDLNLSDKNILGVRRVRTKALGGDVLKILCSDCAPSSIAVKTSNLIRSMELTGDI